MFLLFVLFLFLTVTKQKQCLGRALSNISTRGARPLTHIVMNTVTCWTDFDEQRDFSGRSLMKQQVFYVMFI